MKLLHEVPALGRTRWAVCDQEGKTFYVNIGKPAQIVTIEARRPDRVARTIEVPSVGRTGSSSIRDGGGFIVRPTASGDRQLADSAQHDARDRDANLGARNVGVEVGDRLMQRLRRPTPSATSWSMQVLRTVTSANPAATKNPLARTGATTIARRKARSKASSISYRNSDGRDDT
jgi:hypothetical protein